MKARYLLIGVVALVMSCFANAGAYISINTPVVSATHYTQSRGAHVAGNGQVRQTYNIYDANRPVHHGHGHVNRHNAYNNVYASPLYGQPVYAQPVYVQQAPVQASSEMVYVPPVTGAYEGNSTDVLGSCVGNRGYRVCGYSNGRQVCVTCD